MQKRAQVELPVRASVRYDGVASGEPVVYDDPADIKTLADALIASDASEDAGEVRSDDCTCLGFEFADGTTQSLLFESLTFMVAGNDAWKTYALVPAPELEPYLQSAKAACEQSVDQN